MKITYANKRHPTNRELGRRDNIHVPSAFCFPFLSHIYSKKSFKPSAIGADDLEEMGDLEVILKSLASQTNHLPKQELFPFLSALLECLKS